MPSLHSVSGEVVELGYDLAPKSARLEVDETRRPYAEVELTCPIPPLATLDDLAPREQRLRVVQSRDGADREWDLVLHELSIDHAAAEITVVGRSDEAVLIDEALIGTTSDASAHELAGSLRAIINARLADRGLGALEFSTADASLLPDVTNLVRNPRCGTGTTDWAVSTGGGTTTAARVTTGGPLADAPTYYQVTATSAITSPLVMSNGASGSDVIPVTAGTRYTVSGYVRASVALTGAYIDVLLFNSSGVQVFDGPQNPEAVAANTWERLSASFVAPAGAVRAQVRVVIPQALASGTVARASALMLYPGDFTTAYLDGGCSLTGYTFAWTGTAHASTSTRTRTAGAVSVDALIRTPGQADWDFLAPLVEAAGLRLWCDEQRAWRLEHDDYRVDGTVYISSGFNATRQVERRAVAGIAFKSVIVEYKWTDTAGAQHTAYDIAGTEAPVRLVTRPNTPYPGPGAAQAILTRVQGRGRVLELDAIAQPTATPTQGLTAVLPGLPTQFGTVSSVIWRYPEDEMSVTSRDLLDIEAGAIALLTGTIDSLAGTIDSL